MIPAILAAVLLVAAGPRDGWAAEADPGDSRFRFLADGDSQDESVYLWHVAEGSKVRHEGDPPGSMPLGIRHLDRRRVRVTGDTNPDVTILGGINPHDFAFALAAEELAGSVRGPIPDDATVSLGLGSTRGPIREAAEGVLARKGMAAVPALARGLGSRDLEVRLRCERALSTILVGAE